MTKRMLIDATHAEETRVVVLDGNRLEDFDVETSTKKQLKGNIYLAKVVRVEPSLQAAFVEYGGGRHGFLAFGEIHPDYYQIPVADRQRLLALQAEEARAEEEAEAAEMAGADDDGATPEQPPEVAEAEPAPAMEPEQAERPNHVPSAYAGAFDPVTGAETAETASALNAVTEATAEFGAGEQVVADDTRAFDAPAGATDPDAGQVSVAGAESDASAAPIEPESVNPPSTVVEALPLHVSFGQITYGAVLSDAEQNGREANGVERAAGEPDGQEGEYAEAGDGADVDGADELDRMPPPDTIGGENDTTEGFGLAQARVRSASRILRAYRIQEVIRRRQILLVQVVKEERGTKGAALTTYISLAGRFCVLMPNSPRGGGISRKITSSSDRRRLKEITAELEVPKGMGLIVRTAGAARPKPEIRRDCEYLMRLWDDIREHTMQSIAPALIYEEASLIKRAIRDVYSREVSEILVDGEEGWRSARDFMRMLMPDHAKKVQLWRPANSNGAGGQPLFASQQVEAQLDAMNSPTVQLKSGGYLVINQTEALVAIDVNSGRSTRERGIEETALKTNLEAADEVARQLRLRDLAGLIVIDFIDMEARRHNAMVEKRIQDALKNDRARIQIGHISHFGLLEMSRQRLRPSLAETSFVPCPHCGGSGHMRSVESSAIHVLRAIEEECGKMRGGQILVHVAGPVALYLLNHKRDRLSEIEERFVMRVHLAPDDSLSPPQVRIDRVRTALADSERPVARAVVPVAPRPMEDADDDVPEVADETFDDDEATSGAGSADEAVSAARAVQPARLEGDEAGRSRRRRRRGRGTRRDEAGAPEIGGPEGEGAGGENADAPEGTGFEAVAYEAPLGERGEADLEPAAADAASDEQPGIEAAALDENGLPKPRRRGRRGGRRRRRDGTFEDGVAGEVGGAAETEPQAATPVYIDAPYVGPTPADPFGARPFDIYDLMDEQLPPLDIPAVTLRTEPQPQAKAEPSTFRAADPAPAASTEPLFEPQPEPAPEIPPEVAESAVATVPEHAAGTDDVAKEQARRQATALDVLPPEPTPEPESPAVQQSEKPASPLYAPVLVGADAAPPAPKRGWWKR